MTDKATPNLINRTIRSIWAVLDKAAYFILVIVYQVFFNVASSEILDGKTVSNFIGRAQLILGVIMIFKLTITVLQMIVNPDAIADKNAGMSKVIQRVVISLCLLATLIPMSGGGGEYGTQINNNGLLFGTLYSLQYRILYNNTLARLILGTTDTANFGGNPDGSGGTDSNRLKQSANILASTVLKGFIRYNLIPEDRRTDPGEGRSYEVLNENRMCTVDDKNARLIYTDLAADPNEIIGLVNYKCAKSNPKGGMNEKDAFRFAYVPVVGAITAVALSLVLIGFTVDIAIRACKLAVLRLLAPIPIISYIQPSKNSDMFGTWLKTLIATYLDLFIRLSVIYFIIFMVQDIIVNGVSMNTSFDLVGIFSFIFIILGLFFFAKQAPRFIKQEVLGLKGSSSNIGLSGLLGGTAMALGGGGLRGFAQGAIIGSQTASEAAAQGKEVPLGQIYSKNRDLMAQIRTGDKDAKGGFIGKAMDRLNYGMREDQARKLNMGSRTLAQAKYSADLLEEKASDAQQELNMATQALRALPADATQEQRDAAMARYQKAYQESTQARVDAAKAKSLAEQIEKNRAQMGLAPRMIDTAVPSYRSALQVSKGDFYYDTANPDRPINTRVLDANNPNDAQLIQEYNEKVRTGEYVKRSRAIDSSGNYVAGEEHPEQLTYKRNTKNFTGITDDAPLSGSRGTGATGNNPTAGGGPGPTPPTGGRP